MTMRKGFGDLAKVDGYESPFKYVKKFVSRATGDVHWQARLYIKGGGKATGKFYNTERDAAKAVDVFLINNGREPVNVLKRK
jgi:hypothetical protein